MTKFDEPYYRTYYNGRPYEDTLKWHHFGYDRLVAFLQDTLGKDYSEKVPLKGKTILDIGCAFGHTMLSFRQGGMVPVGFDISEFAITNKLPIFNSFTLWQGDFDTELPKFKNTSITYTFTNCFQYARDLAHLKFLLSETFRISRCATFLVIATPDRERWVPIADSVPYAIWEPLSIWLKLLREVGYEDLLVHPDHPIIGARKIK